MLVAPRPMDDLILGPLCPDTHLSRQVHQIVHDMLEETTQRSFGGNSCLLTDVGDYVIYLLRTISRLVRTLHDSRHWDSWRKERVNHELKETDASDMQPVMKLRDKFFVFSEIADRLDSTLAISEKDWNKVTGNDGMSSPLRQQQQPLPQSLPLPLPPPLPQQPQPQPQPQQHQYQHQDHRQHQDQRPRRKSLGLSPPVPPPATVGKTNSNWSLVPAPSSFRRPLDISARPHQMLNTELGVGLTKASRTTSISVASILSDAPSSGETTQGSENLKRRGKMDDWTCEFGLSCQHGGVLDDGTLKVFQQHSAIRAHISKHNKPWKCTKPNCPNKGGFARKDQLERHMKKVAHDP